jgi:hypothetical protein
MKRLKNLEETGARPSAGQEQAGKDLVPRESWELVNKEKGDLEELVRQKEKRLLRLQQVCPQWFTVTPYVRSDCLFKGLQLEEC